MSVKKISKIGSPDHGHYSIKCDDARCADINGRPWQQLYPRATVEGWTLAHRDALEHNETHHSAEAGK